MQTRNASDALGIDVSEYQGNIDWNAVKTSGISFSFIKASEGTSITDSMFSTNYAAAKSAGVLRGAYHYARPGESSATQQATHFLNVVDAVGGIDELPAALDVEDNGGLTNQELAAWIRSWVSQVASSTGKTPLLYTYVSFANSYLEPGLANLQLWLAEYGVAEPQNAGGWTTWTFWQYTDTGSVSGISGNVDLDVYSGGINQLTTTYGSSTPAPAPTPSYTQFNVFVLDHVYSAIAVGDVTYVLWTALNTLGTPHTYKGSGLMNVNGTDVQGVVFQGNTYLPWDSLAPGIQSQRVWQFYT